MAERQEREVPTLLVRSGQPLVGVLTEENGQEMVRYFSDEEVGASGDSNQHTQAALALAGAWSDLNWPEMEQQLERIRHETPPSPPLTV